MQKLNRIKEKLLTRLDTLTKEKVEHEKILMQEKLSTEESRMELEYITTLSGKILEVNNVIKLINEELYG
nr:MAG TPA: hypothetical protein [Caudoviricetes sp.]